MKFIVGLVLGILVIVFMVQNVHVIELKYMGWNFSISLALLILIVVVVGIIIGYVVKSIGVRKVRLEKEKGMVEEKEEPEETF